MFNNTLNIFKTLWGELKYFFGKDFPAFSIRYVCILLNIHLVVYGVQNDGIDCVYKNATNLFVNKPSKCYGLKLCSP